MTSFSEGVALQGGGMPTMDSFSDGDMDSPLQPLDDLVSSPTSSDPYGSGGEHKDKSASVSVDSGYFQMPNTLQSADTSSQLAAPTLGGSGSVDSGSSSYLPAPMLGGSGSVDSGSSSSYLPAPMLGGSGSVDSGSASKPGLGHVDSGGSALVDSGSSLKPPSFGGSGLVDSGSAYLPAPGVTSDGAGINMASANRLGETLGDLSSSDAVFNVSSSSQQSTEFDTIFGGSMASSTNSGYLPAPMGAESASAMPNQSTESSSFFTPGNVSSSSAGGFPGSFPGMADMGKDDLDDFELPPLPDSLDPIPPTGQGGVSSYGGSFVTFGRTPQH